jgi:hypothetical protein
MVAALEAQSCRRRLRGRARAAPINVLTAPLSGSGSAHAGCRDMSAGSSTKDEIVTLVAAVG